MFGRRGSEFSGLFVFTQTAASVILRPRLKRAECCLLIEGRRVGMEGTAWGVQWQCRLENRGAFPLAGNYSIYLFIYFYYILSIHLFIFIDD